LTGQLTAGTAEWIRRYGYPAHDARAALAALFRASKPAIRRMIWFSYVRVWWVVHRPRSPHISLKERRRYQARKAFDEAADLVLRYGAFVAALHGKRMRHATRRCP